MARQVGRRKAIADQPEPVREAFKHRMLRDARLVVETAEAEAVVRVYEGRARGEPYAHITRGLEADLGRLVNKGLARQIVRNRAYVGEARAVVKGETMVKQEAHPAIISPELWAAANRIKSPPVVHDGSLSAQALLGGVVCCACCGHRMAVKGNMRRGERRAFYSCARKSSRGDCAAPSSAYVDVVDEYVVSLLSQDESGAVSAVGDAEQVWLEAKERVRAAESDRDELVADRGGLALATWRTMVADLDRAVEDARAALYALDDPGIAEAPTVFLGGRLWAYKPWGEDREADGARCAATSAR